MKASDSRNQQVFPESCGQQGKANIVPKFLCQPNIGEQNSGLQALCNVLLSPSSYMLSQSASPNVRSSFLESVLAAIAEQCDAQAASLWRHDKMEKILRLLATYVSNDLEEAVNDACDCRKRSVKAGPVWQELSSRRVPMMVSARKEARIPFQRLSKLPQTWNTRC